MTNIGNTKSDSPHLAIFASYSNCSKESLRQSDQEALVSYKIIVELVNRCKLILPKYDMKQL